MGDGSLFCIVLHTTGIIRYSTYKYCISSHLHCKQMMYGTVCDDLYFNCTAENFDIILGTIAPYIFNLVSDIIR